MTRIIDPLEQFFDDAGDPLIDGLLYFYETGTNTALDTFSDINLTTPNTNPLQLTAAGRSPNAYGYNRLYRVVLKNIAGVQILQRDNVGSFSAEGALESWIFDKTYTKSELVTYNFKFYRSNLDGNIGNFPNSASQWSEIDFPEKYNSAVMYDSGKLVYDANILYVSAQDANVGNAPATAHAWWQRVNSIPHWGSATNYKTYDYALNSIGKLNKAAANNIGQNPATANVNWNQIKEHFEYSSAKTYSSGEYAYDGEIRYISKQSANTNHQPSADTTETWWKPDWQAFAPLTTVRTMTGGGALTPFTAHDLTDSSTYTLPLASTVAIGGFIDAVKPEQYKGFQPIVSRSGSDSIRYNGGTDTSVRYTLNYRSGLRYKSNGVDEWSI